MRPHDGIDKKSFQEFYIDVIKVHICVKLRANFEEIPTRISEVGVRFNDKFLKWNSLLEVDEMTFPTIRHSDLKLSGI